MPDLSGFVIEFPEGHVIISFAIPTGSSHYSSHSNLFRPCAGVYHLTIGEDIIEKSKVWYFGHNSLFGWHFSWLDNTHFRNSPRDVINYSTCSYIMAVHSDLSGSPDNAVTVTMTTQSWHVPAKLIIHGCDINAGLRPSAGRHLALFP